MSRAISATHLNKRYGTAKVTDDVSLDVNEGELYCLVGDSGSGKTTLLSLLCGLAKPDSGTVEIFGSSLKSNGARLGAMIGDAGTVADLTVKENLTMAAIAKGVVRANATADSLISFLSLKPYAGTPASECPPRTTVLLRLGIALVRSPDCLLLDEPFRNLDSTSSLKMRELLEHLNKHSGMTILLCDQSPINNRRIATHYGILREGRIVLSGSAAEIEQRCGRSITLRTSTNDQTLVILQEAFPSAEFTMLENKKIQARNIKIELLAETLFNAGQQVLELHENKVGLESYFSSLTR